MSRLTNDVNSYLGAGLDADRNSLVTSRSEMRSAIWLGDGAARSGAEVVPPTRVAGPFVSVAWAGERLLHDTITNGQPSIVSIVPGVGTPVEVASNANSAVATSDGKTIVFMKPGAEASLEGRGRRSPAGRTCIRGGPHTSDVTRRSARDLSLGARRLKRHGWCTD